MSQFSIGLTESQIRSVKHMAYLRGISASALIREMIEREIDSRINVQIVGRPKLAVIQGGKTAEPERQAVEGLARAE